LVAVAEDAAADAPITVRLLPDVIAVPDEKPIAVLLAPDVMPVSEEPPS
jgi:hypothetical protein